VLTVSVKENYFIKIRNLYLKREYEKLFQTILEASKTVGLEEALKYLEKCVIEKRLQWLHGNLCKIEKDRNLLDYGFGSE